MELLLCSLKDINTKDTRQETHSRLYRRDAGERGIGISISKTHVAACFLRMEKQERGKTRSGFQEVFS